MSPEKRIEHLLQLAKRSRDGEHTEPYELAETAEEMQHSAAENIRLRSLLQEAGEMLGLLVGTQSSDIGLDEMERRAKAAIAKIKAELGDLPRQQEGEKT